MREGGADHLNAIPRTTCSKTAASPLAQLQHDTCPGEPGAHQLVICHSIVFKVLLLFTFFHHFLIFVFVLSAAWQ